MTNGDKIRNMTDEELAVVLMCPYDTAGAELDIMPCVKDGNVQEFASPKDCRACSIKWLQREVSADET